MLYELDSLIYSGLFVWHNEVLMMRGNKNKHSFYGFHWKLFAMVVHSKDLYKESRKFYYILKLILEYVFSENFFSYFKVKLHIIYFSEIYNDLPKIILV